MTRKCNKCGVSKEETEFYAVTQHSVTRVRAICKDCSKAQLRDRSNEPKPDGRTCTQCGAYKPLSDFHKHKYAAHGVDPMCKACRLRKRRLYGKLYPERIRNTGLRIRYGITLEDFVAMRAKQQGRCAICDAVDERLVVDHNHQTGKVRGLLCHLCNAMIGCAREDPVILTAALAYLYAEQHPEAVPMCAEVTFARVPTVAR